MDAELSSCFIFKSRPSDWIKSKHYITTVAKADYQLGQEASLYLRNSMPMGYRWVVIPKESPIGCNGSGKLPDAGFLGQVAG